MIDPLLAPIALLAVFVLIAKLWHMLNNMASGSECPECGSKRVELAKAGRQTHASCADCGTEGFY